MKTYPLLQAQLGIFTQCIQHSTSTQYNLPSDTEIPSTIDIDRLANAWEKVLDERKELRGFRIELGEIESAISKYEGIRSSVVEVKEIGNVQHLCGYYTSVEAIDEQELRRDLSSSIEFGVTDDLFWMYSNYDSSKPTFVFVHGPIVEPNIRRTSFESNQ